jgi:hypothetical protein
VPNILYWHPSAVHSRYPPTKLDPDIGSFDWQVKRLEEFYNNLDRSQENVEKLRVCEAVARAEFYTNQILVSSEEDSVYRIDLIDEQDYAKLRFKISLQAPNRLWTLPKWVCLDSNVVTPEEYLIWNWIDTVKRHGRYSIHDWAYQWYKMRSNMPLEIMRLKILMNFQKTDVDKVLPDDVQEELDRLSSLKPEAIQYQHMFCYSLEDTPVNGTTKRIKTDIGTYCKLSDVSLYRIASPKVDDYLRDLQETINCFPNTIIRINQIPISSICIELLLNPFVDDDRPIPSNSSGKQISVFFTKWYLDQKIKEWIALGGVRDWFDGLEVCERGGGHKHIRMFYWDLWADIATFREEAKIVDHGITKLSYAYKSRKALSSCAVQLSF